MQGTVAPAPGPRPDIEHSPEKMRQVARAMRAELGKLTSGTAGRQGTVTAIGEWDVPEQLTARVSSAHEALLDYVTQFAKSYEEVIERIETSARDFDLTDLAAKNSAANVGRSMEPRATRESQN